MKVRYIKVSIPIHIEHLEIKAESPRGRDDLSLQKGSAFVSANKYIATPIQELWLWPPEYVGQMQAPDRSTVRSENEFRRTEATYPVIGKQQDRINSGIRNYNIW